MTKQWAVTPSRAHWASCVNNSGETYLVSRHVCSLGSGASVLLFRKLERNLLLLAEPPLSVSLTKAERATRQSHIVKQSWGALHSCRSKNKDKKQKEAKWFIISVWTSSWETWKTRIKSFHWVTAFRRRATPCAKWNGTSARLVGAARRSCAWYETDAPWPGLRCKDGRADAGLQL